MKRGFVDGIYRILSSKRLYCCRFSMKGKYSAEDKDDPYGIFSLEFGEITVDTAKIFHAIDGSLSYIQPGDVVARIHVSNPDKNNNPDGKSNKDLMIDGMKWVRDIIKDNMKELSDIKGSKYFVSYSYITPKLAEKYGFQIYDVPYDIKRYHFGGRVLRSFKDFREGKLEKYTMDDIKLLVQPIEDILNISDEYFEELRK